LMHGLIVEVLELGEPEMGREKVGHRSEKVIPVGRKRLFDIVKS
jgi:hypothetical protein